MVFSSPKLLNETGPDFKDKIVRPLTRTKIRDNAVYYQAIELFSSRRDEFQQRIYKSIEDDINLLKNIGISQMEIETEKQYKKISKKMREKELNNSENYDLSPENVKEHIKNILGEIHKTNKDSK